MDSTVRRISVLVVAIAAAALSFTLPLGLWTSARGVAGPTLADAERPVLAVGATLVAFALATAIAAVVGRMLNAVVGIFVLGTGVGLLSMRSGAAADFAFGGSTPMLAAIELVGWAALVAAGSHVVYRFAGSLPDLPPTHEEEIDSPTGRAARMSWLGGIAAVAAAWVAVATVSKGQALGAAVIGGFAAGAVGRFLAPRTTPVYLAAAPLVAFAAVFAFLGFTMRGDLSAGFVDGSYPRLLRLMPVDLAAGALAGTALGFGFARSFANSRDE